jgi:peptidoglycan/LPS O-acetylase OafA/YrhL
MNYREDIDCLRGIAVLSVIFFHLKIYPFSGGYLGVDIFFVISGYLITTLILSEIKTKTFSFANFYERRIRRIAPNLFFVIFITTIFFNYIFLPDEKNFFYKGLISTILYSSNFFFFLSGSYFDPVNENNPILHFWSLAVEEQFYIFFPIIIFIFRKKMHLYIYLFFFLFLSSFFLNQFGGNLKFSYPYFERSFQWMSIPKFSFYLLPTRIWEFMSGSIAAYVLLNKKILKNSYLSLLGYLLIFSSIIIFSKETPHPSLVTFIPILGVFLVIIFNDKKNFLFKYINNYFFLQIGIASYSLYLWHQPIYQFFLSYTFYTPIFYEKLYILLLIFLTSFLSYLYIEKPFRNKNFLNKKIVFLLFFILTLIYLFIFAISLYYKNKNNGYPEEVIRIINEKNYFEFNKFKCGSSPERYIKPENSCILGSSKNVKYALIGDSHLDLISLNLNKELENLKLGAAQLTYNGCMPSTNLKVWGDRRYRCHEYYSDVLKFIEKNNDIKTIILFARWSFYLTGNRFDNKEGGIEHGQNHYLIELSENYVFDENVRKYKILDNFENFLKELKKNNKDIIIILPTPEMGWDIPSSLARKLLIYKRLDKNDFSISLNIFNNRNIDILNFFNSNKNKYNLKLFHTNNLFCDIKKCYSHKKNIPLYMDDDHLSELGSQILVKEIKKLLAQ